MFGFGKKNPQRVRIEDVDALADALAGLGARLEELEERDALTKLEVADWYEKFRALYARLNKRAARLEDSGATVDRHEPNPAALRILGGMK